MQCISITENGFIMVILFIILSKKDGKDESKRNSQIDVAGSDSMVSRYIMEVVRIFHDSQIDVAGSDGIVIPYNGGGENILQFTDWWRLELGLCILLWFIGCINTLAIWYISYHSF